MSASLVDLAYALGLTAFVSLSGVMMPGPVFAAAVAKGYEDRLAGVWIALGHGAVEVPLMAALFLGFAYLVEVPLFTAAVGAVGGAFLVYLGVSMAWAQRRTVETPPLPYHPLVLGVVTTVANPFFFLWWATVGLALILLVFPFALVGFVAFALVHWSCDLGWNGLVAATAHRTRGAWKPPVRRGVFVAVGIFLAALGVWFLITGLMGGMTGP